MSSVPDSAATTVGSPRGAAGRKARPTPRWAGGAARRSRSGHEARERRAALLYVAPATVVVVGISVFPLLYTVWLSFTNYRLTSSNRDFAGLDNYVDVLTNPLVLRAATNTLVFSGCSVVLSLVLGIALANLVSRLTVAKRLFRTVFFLPMLLASAVVGVIWRFLFNDQVGLIPMASRALGFEGSWLADPKLAMASVIIVDVWQWTPFVFLLVIAGMDALPLDPIEAARIDGANGWQIFCHVVLPALKGIIMIALVFRITWSLRAFDHIYTMTQGGPGGATEVLSLAVWRNAFVNLDFGRSSAIAMVMFVVMAIIAVALLRNSRAKD